MRKLLLSLGLLGVLLLSYPARPGLAAQAVNVASYQIAVRLDVQSKQLSAQETISYTNRSGDPIPDLIFHLYLNAFRDANSIFLRESSGQSRGFAWDPQHPGWIQVESARLSSGEALNVQEIEDGTLARASLPRPIQPGETLQIVIAFRAQLPRVFARTGYAGSAGDYFMVGQWFPKLGVWENGAWNAYPFHANSEFFADFGAYDVSITLPSNYKTGGVGLAVGRVENGDGTQTVRYHADPVIDFSWTASPHFLSASRQVGSTEIIYLYLPEHAWSVKRALFAAQAALDTYSTWYGSYPYPRLTVVDVPDDGEGAGGMEYPTLVTAGTASALLLPSVEQLGWDRSLELVIAHEIGHQWWYALVAFNEAEEPWLDEGFTDYSTVRLFEKIFPPDSSAFRLGDYHFSYLEFHRLEYLFIPRLPMLAKAWDFKTPEAYEVGAYSKPDVSLTTLQNVLGEANMQKLMATFFQRYQYLHPTTDDFEKVAQKVSGQELSWFFDGLVRGDQVLNYKVSSVEAHSVTVQRQGELTIPTEVQVTFADGSQKVEAWQGKETEKSFTYPVGSEVKQAIVDPQRKLVVDLLWSDNGLERQVQVNSWLAVIVRMLYNLQNGLLLWGGF